MPWKAVAGAGAGAAAAIHLPLAAVVIALAAAFGAPRGSPLVRAGVLTALGLAGLASLPFLGRFAGAPAAPLALAPITVTLAAAAVALRLHDPSSRRARIALAVATGLTLVAMLIPFDEAQRVLPIEVIFWLRDHEALDRSTSLGAYLEVWNSDPNVLFICAFGVAPLALLPAALALAWPAPSGVWDRHGMALRPIGWVLALYLPIAYLLAAFNLTGMEVPGLVSTGEYVATYEDFVKTTMMGRIKLAVLAAGFSLWAALGAIPLIKRVRA